jgi:hypothetical protein
MEWYGTPFGKKLSEYATRKFQVCQILLEVVQDRRSELTCLEALFGNEDGA